MNNLLSYPKFIHNLIKRMEHDKFTNFENCITLSTELLTLAHDSKDIYLECIALNHLGQANMSLGNFFLSSKQLLNALKLQKKHHYSDLLCNTYNLLAVNYYHQDDKATCLEYYYSGLNIALEQQDFSMQCKFYNNIGVLYLDHSDFLTALSYFQTCYDLFQKEDPSHPHGRPFDPLEQCLYLNFASCHIGLGEFYTARIYLKKYGPSNPPTASSFVEYMFLNATICNHFRELEDSVIWCKQLIRFVSNDLSSLNYFTSFTELIDLYLDLHLYQDTKKLLHLIASSIEPKSSPNRFLIIATCYLRYYKAVNDTKNYNKYLGYYYSYHKKSHKEYEESICNAIDQRLQLEQETKEYEQIKQNNETLSIRSSTDALTGVGNRYGLTEQNVLFFEKSKLAQVPYGVLIIDIDYLKEYNDTLGHMAGDCCIRAVANCIQSFLSEDYYLARYGGDEFFVICHKKTKQELCMLASNLICSVLEKNLTFLKNDQLKCITLSIGIANQIPNDTLTPQDYMHAADVQLYTIKKGSKNGYAITTNIATP